MKKEQLPLVIGLAIPVILVIVLAAIIFLPRLYVKPQYDFVYAVGSYPTYVDTAAKTRTVYRVVDGHVTKEVSAIDISESRGYYGSYESTSPHFYRYDVEKKENIQLTEEAARQLTLDPSLEAPDGFKLDYAQDNDNLFGAIFGERDYDQRVLEKGSVAVPVKAIPDTDRYGYRDDMGFIGWVVK